MVTTEINGAVHVVASSTAITKDSLDELRNAVLGSCSQGQPAIVLDLSRTPLIDSAGLELLLDLQDSCTRVGGSIRLAAPQAVVADTLHITGVGRHFEAFATSRAAVGSFTR